MDLYTLYLSYFSSQSGIYLCLTVCWILYICHYLWIRSSYKVLHSTYAHHTSPYPHCIVYRVLGIYIHSFSTHPHLPMHSISPYGINAFNVFAVLLFVYLPALSSVCLFVRLFVCLFVCLRLALAHRFQKSKLKYETPVEIYMRIIGERLREREGERQG